MTKRRLVLWCSLSLTAAGAIALAVPDCRYRLIAAITNEPLIEGRPIDFWIGVLKNGEPEERRRSAILLGEANVCQDATKDDDACRRVIAALIDALGDEDGFVRKCAATSFLLFPRDAPAPDDAVVVAKMRGALTDKEVAVRRAAAQALWQVGAPAKQADGVARLSEALGDNDQTVRMFAARAIGKIGPDAHAAVPALLLRLQKDEESDVRKLAAKALGLIGAKGNGAHLPDVVQALAQSLQSKNAGLREYSARAIGELGGKEAIPALRVAERDSDENVREAVREALQRLEKSP